MAGLLSDDSSNSGFGDVFGGAGNSLLAPFLGQQGMDAARDNTLMSLGASLMANSGPSLDPSHRSLTAALGPSLLGASQNYQNNMKSGLGNVGAAQGLALNKLNYQQQLMWLQQAMKRMGGGMGGAAPVAQGASGTSMPGVGVPPIGGATVPQQPNASPNGMGGGTTPAFSGPTGAGNGGPASTPPTSSAGPAGDNTDPLNPLGMPEGLVGMAMLNPATREELLKQNMAAYLPTDLMKEMNAAGIGKDTPLGKALLSQVIQKQASNLSASRPGAPIVNMTTGQTVSIAPDLNSGRQGVALPGGGFGISLMPGATQATAQNDAAAAEGKGIMEPQKGVTPGGTPYEGSRLAMMTGSGAIPNLTGLPLGGGFGIGQGGAPLPNGQGAGTVNQPPLPQGTVQTGLSPGQEVMQKGDAENFIDAKKGAIQQGLSAQNALDRATANRTLIEQAEMGPGAPEWNSFGKMLNQAGMLNSDEAAKVSATTMLDKNTQQSVMDNLKNTFPGRVSNMEMGALKNALGGIDNPKDTARYINDMTIAKLDRQQQFSQFMQTYQGSPGDFQNQWLNSPQGSRSLFEDPAMIRHLQIVKGNSGATAAVVPTPTGHKYLPVAQDGQGNWMPTQ